MTYKQIKWLILVIPTLTIGIWEYVRHEFLLPYISMDMGNWLAPVLVLLVSLLLLTRLFAMIEHNQSELEKAKAVQVVLEEREKMARELHDGIAQSLFFLNAQVSHMERMQHEQGLPLYKLKESVQRTNDYVRQAIANLRHEAEPSLAPWRQGLDSLIEELRHETAILFEMSWELPDSLLSSKEKVELLAIVREALLNIHKHANASHVTIRAWATQGGWVCRIADDGNGFHPEETAGQNRYGLKIMKDRAQAMSWRLDIARQEGETAVIIQEGSISDVDVFSSADYR